MDRKLTLTLGAACAIAAAVGAVLLTSAAAGRGAAGVSAQPGGPTVIEVSASPDSQPSPAAAPTAATAAARAPRPVVLAAEAQVLGVKPFPPSGAGRPASLPAFFYRPLVEQTSPRRAPDPGLCASCVHGRTISGARSAFWLCELSRTDPRFPRYPRIPVLRCDGYSPDPGSPVSRAARP